MMLFTALLGGHPLAAQPELDDLVGTYEMQLDIATKAKVPVIGDTTVLSRQKMVARVTLSDGKLTVSHDACSLAARTRPALAGTRFPAAFIEAIPSKTYALELTSDEAGWLAHMDLGPLAIGYDPARSPVLPTAVDHPAVTDWDDDGKPAATIHLDVPLFGTIEVYQVQTAHAVLDGRVVGVNRIEGGAKVIDFYQRTLSASNRLFVQNPTLTNDPSRSSFQLSRVAADAQCADIPVARVE